MQLIGKSGQKRATTRLTGNGSIPFFGIQHELLLRLTNFASNLCKKAVEVIIISDEEQRVKLQATADSLTFRVCLASFRMAFLASWNSTQYLCGDIDSHRLQPNVSIVMGAYMKNHGTCFMESDSSVKTHFRHWWISRRGSGSDCKSDVFGFGWFDSTSTNFFKNVALKKNFHSF